MEDVIIRCINLPIGVNGFVRKDSDDNYNVYINAKLPMSVQQSVLRHEIEHIERGDYWNDIEITDVESAV